MKKISETQSIGDFLSSSTFKNILDSTKLDVLAKHSTIFSFWKDIAGSKFAKFTRPNKIKADKLFVSAKSPVVVQELNLHKAILLKKINSYSMPLGIEINDIVFNYKNFNEAKEDKAFEGLVEDKPKQITDGMLNSIELSKKTLEELKEQISKISFLSSKQKDTFLDKIISAKKAEMIRKELC